MFMQLLRYQIIFSLQPVSSPTRDRTQSIFDVNNSTKEDVLTGVCPLMIVANEKGRHTEERWCDEEAPLPLPPTYVDRFLVGEKTLD